MKNFIASHGWRMALLAAVFLPACAHATIFSVTNVNDTGTGSLRQAILDSNAAGGSNSIEFDLSGAGPWIIKPQVGFLPPLRGPVTLGMKPPTATPAPQPAAGSPFRVAQVPFAPPVTQLAPKVILDASLLLKPRTPSECPGATYNWNEQTHQWDMSDQRGTGPNVRGYFGPGLAVQDSHDVEISGIEIHGFCAGIVTVRSSNVYIHDVKVTDSMGAAGIIFTGDDGKAGRTDLSHDNRVVHSLLLDNGDGFEFTRGTHNSYVQNTYIGLTQPLPEDGNAVEFASSGDNNALIGNTFTKYADAAVAVSGNNQTIRDNLFLDNSSDGLRTLNGSGLLLLGNTFRNNGGAAILIGTPRSRVIDNVITGNAQGIVLSSATVTLSRNSVSDNIQSGIAYASPKPARPSMPPATASARPPAPPNAGPPPPPVTEIPLAPALLSTSTWNTSEAKIRGSIEGKPNASYEVQVFASPLEDRHSGAEHGLGEGKTYIGTARASTDSKGKGQFFLPTMLPEMRGMQMKEAYFTATATDADGSTSKFSKSLMLANAK